jgi:hypothetical protein
MRAKNIGESERASEQERACQRVGAGCVHVHLDMGPSNTVRDGCVRPPKQREGSKLATTSHSELLNGRSVVFSITQPLTNPLLESVSPVTSHAKFPSFVSEDCPHAECSKDEHETSRSIARMGNTVAEQ